jgi:STIP1 family protein 1
VPPCGSRVIAVVSASDLAKEQKLNFGDDIAAQLRSARKKRFSIQEEKRIAQEIDLLTYLTKLIKIDKETQIENVKKEGLENDEEQDKVREIEEECVSGRIFQLVARKSLALVRS